MHFAEILQRERERQRDREKQRERERQRERDRQRETERQKETWDISYCLLLNSILLKSLSSRLLLSGSQLHCLSDTLTQ